MVLELGYTFLMPRAKAQRGLEQPRPSLFLPLFTEGLEGAFSEVHERHGGGGSEEMQA
jgi:hypothetical protein